ncbi:MAG: hypothetical protein ACK5P7_11320 [Bdellovibrio sp.]
MKHNTSNQQSSAKPNPFQNGFRPTSKPMSDFIKKPLVAPVVQVQAPAETLKLSLNQMEMI